MVSKKLRLASDIEAVGFYDSVKNKSDIHCLCSIDIDDNTVYLFHDHPEFDGVEVIDKDDGRTYNIPPRSGTLEDGVIFWRNAAVSGGMLVIHNCFGYDKLILDKLWPDNGIPFEAYRDTYVQSKVQWFDRSTPKGAKSPHGLQAWGIRCGVLKPEITDWTYMDAYKLHRVIEDCKIQAKTFLMLEKEREVCLEKLDVDFIRAIEIESKYSYHVSMQEIRGALVDKSYIVSCIEYLDGKISHLEDEITPLLPPTVKGSGSKVSRKEVAKLLGFNPDKINDKFVERTINGKVEIVVEKPYFKPSVNFRKNVQLTEYSGFHITYGYSPKFLKLKELKEWVASNCSDTKFTEWVVSKDVVTSQVLNKNTCDYWEIQEDSDLIAGPYTKTIVEKSSMSQSEVVKKYLIKLGWKDADEWNIKKDSTGAVVRATYDTEIRWPINADKENQMVKKIKKGDPIVTTPKLSEEDYSQLPDGVGRKIAEYNTYQHRRRFLSNPKDPENKGVLSFIRDDGRIPCGVNNFGTSTGRSSHRVFVNVPGEKSLYGSELRGIIVAPEGKSLVGVDQKSSQLSIAAFFAKNATYYKAVAAGQEFDSNKKYIGESAHCYSARNFGLVSINEWDEAKRTQDADLIKSISLRRSDSKGASFGVIFGCSGKKLAGMLKVPESEGNKKKDLFLKQMGLEGVKDYLLNVCKVKYKRASGFYIPLAFGYWVWCSQDHKAINYLIQGTEALAQKLAELKFDKEVKGTGLIGRCGQILSMHDEYLCEVDTDIADQVGKLAESSFTWAADQIYKWYMQNPDKFPNDGCPAFKIDLAGGYKVGKKYSDCH